MEEVFQQDLKGEGPAPGGPFLIQMLFREPVPMPEKEAMAAALERHVGKVEAFCHDEKTAGFAALEHVAEFRDGKAPVQGPDRFIRFGVNARFFNIQGTEDMLVDTVGMSTLFLPDLQYHFHGMDPNWVVNHAYNLASYLLLNDCPIESGETVDGVTGGKMDRSVQWKCQYEEALIQPPRHVLDVCMGPYAAGSR